MGNVYMEADQVRFKNSTYHNLQTAVSAALEGGGGGGTTVVANPEGSATADLAKLQVGETIYGIPAEAGDISYDNTSSGMTADDVQEAIDELNTGLSGVTELIPSDATSSNKLATAADIPGVATTSAPGIVQPDGTTVTIVDGVISAAGGSGGEVYSATETVIGSWLGSTLYRKVVDLPTLPNNTTKFYDNLVPDNITVRRIEGYYSDGTYVIPIPFSEPQGLTGTITIGAQTTSGGQIRIYVQTGQDRSAADGYAIVEYTKNS